MDKKLNSETGVGVLLLANLDLQLAIVKCGSNLYLFF